MKDNTDIENKYVKLKHVKDVEFNKYQGQLL